MFFGKNKSDRLKDSIKEEIKKGNENIFKVTKSIILCVEVLNDYFKEFSKKIDPLRRDEIPGDEFIKVIIDIETNYAFIKEAKGQFDEIVHVFDRVLADRKILHQSIHDTLDLNNISQEIKDECPFCLNDKKNDEDQ